VLPFGVFSAATDEDTATPGKWRSPAAPFAPWPVSVLEMRHAAGRG
jgi:hypothetical protein